MHLSRGVVCLGGWSLKLLILGVSNVNIYVTKMCFKGSRLLRETSQVSNLESVARRRKRRVVYKVVTDGIPAGLRDAQSTRLETIECSGKLFQG